MQSLECQIRAAPRIGAGRPVTVHFRLAQRAPETVYVLDWRTPLEGLRGDDFEIVRHGTHVRYRGPMLKRGNPGARSYRLLAPGAPLEAEIDLALAYDFTVPGHYRVTFRGALMDLVTRASEIPRPLDALQSVTVPCAPITIEIVR
jgi:hypothetical protein